MDWLQVIVKSENEQSENCGEPGRYKSENYKGCGSCSKHSDGYGPGHSERIEDSNENSDDADRNRRNGTSNCVDAC